MSAKRVSYQEALRLTLELIDPLGCEVLELSRLSGRTAACRAESLVDSPTMDVSLKDGYAVVSADVSGASPETPARLAIMGEVAPGSKFAGRVESGQAVRVLTGAPVPEGAQAILSDEFASGDGHTVTAVNDAEPGRNILKKGGDLAKGEAVILPGETITPPKIGLLAAAGISSLEVFRTPKTAILSTGDEIVAPGTPLEHGKLYASNAACIAAWCERYGIETTIRIAPDDPKTMEKSMVEALEEFDALVTSGGVWKGDRDYVFDMLERIGWTPAYRHVRMGPGKSAGFGTAGKKPVFCLPGGPPSNHTALVLLALPGLLKMAGREGFSLPVARARLSSAIRGQVGWTQVVHGRLERESGEIVFVPMEMKSRLKMMAVADGIVIVEESSSGMAEKAFVEVLLLDHERHDRR